MNQKRDRAVVLRVDHLTQSEEEKMVNGIRKLKKKVAPDGKAALLQGPAKELPRKVRQIGFDDD